MAIQVTCEGCGKRFTTKDEWAGRALRCKSCGATVHVPQPEVDLASVDLDSLGELEASSRPLPPVRRAKPSPQSRVLLPLSKLGRWKVPVIAAALMLLLAIPGLLSYALLGLAVFIGVVVSFGLLLCGLGLLVFRVFQLASKEGSGAVFQVIFWTRAGRRFVYSQWRDYARPGLFLLQGCLLFALTIPLIMLLVRARDALEAEQAKAPPPAERELTAEELEEQRKRQDEQEKAMRAEAERVQREMDERIERQRERREARAAEMRKQAQRSPEERKKDMIDRFGAESVVTVHVEQVSADVSPAIASRVRELAGTKNMTSSFSAGKLYVITAPVSDLAALAERIDFGEVSQVDEAERSITVVADPEKLP